MTLQKPLRFFPQTAEKIKAMGACTRSQASRAMDKNVGSVFEQRKALARLRAHLRDEVRIVRTEPARDGDFASLERIQAP